MMGWKRPLRAKPWPSPPEPSSSIWWRAPRLWPISCANTMSSQVEPRLEPSLVTLTLVTSVMAEGK